ncbi:MAG TPA: LLM class F420-dependent oxidoreductase [Acidimicrobiales bacterium]|nr:LLM class F420-dependent oxidoreductase [Acidimicrobiales bacterium]
MIRLGLQIPSFTYPGVPDDQLFERVADIAVTAEESGFDSVYVMDHLFQLPLLGRPDQPMFECYTLLSALAARTKRVKLGAMVGAVTYRNPGLLAKEVTALDVISQGRAIWAIGAGWFELEHDALGFQFGTFTERFEKLEEALQIVKSMFVNPTTTFEGKWYSVKDAYNVPRPVTPGGPPVLVGGSGERKTLRIVAQYADACNVSGDAATVRHLMDVLDAHCERLGRDPSTVTRTRLGTLILGTTHDDAIARRNAMLGSRGVNWDTLPDNVRTDLSARFTVGDADEVGEQVQAFLAAGLDGVIWNLPTAYVLDDVAHAGQVLSKILT